MPLVFLEGPVQGARDWQTKFAEQLLDRVPNIAVASPRALPFHQDNFSSRDAETKRRTSERQVAYEFLARRRAFQLGVIAMWYAEQDPTIPYDPARRYAKTTQIEHGEVLGWKAAHSEYPFIIGFAPAFLEGPDNSRGYLGRNDALDGITEYTSLDDVFNATVDALEQIVSEGRQPILALTSQSRQRALDQLG